MRSGNEPRASAILSVRVAFGHPRRFADLADCLVLDRPYLMPGSRRFPQPWSIDEGTGNFIIRDTA
jgi:hypothetical protein